jgi:hypothetical protein
MATKTGKFVLTQKGEAFIRAACSGGGNSLLQGKNKGVLPYCDPVTSPSKIWVSNARHNNVLITTNQQLGEALIDWYNKYGNMYQMDANVMAAQAFQESGYFVWNYPTTSTASGIGQFTTDAVYDVIITNNYSYITPHMTTAEIQAIISGTFGIGGSYDTTYNVASVTGKKNRPIMHQNIIDNPEIMIKAQFRYMKIIAAVGKTSLTSQVLFGYSRGLGLIKSTYSDSIERATKYSPNYQIEGIDYVFKIFRYLGYPQTIGGIKGMYFGYDDLGVNVYPNPNFDALSADAQ